MIFFGGPKKQNLALKKQREIITRISKKNRVQELSDRIQTDSMRQSQQGQSHSRYYGRGFDMASVPVARHSGESENEYQARMRAIRIEASRRHHEHQQQQGVHNEETAQVKHDDTDLTEVKLIKDFETQEGAMKKFGNWLSKTNQKTNRKTSSLIGTASGPAMIAFLLVIILLLHVTLSKVVIDNQSTTRLNAAMGVMSGKYSMA